MVGGAQHGIAAGAERLPYRIRFSNVFRGQIKGNVITGDWADVPKGEILQSGQLTVTATSSATLRRVAVTGGFGGSLWTRIATGPDPCDLSCRFNAVRRNDGGTMADHLSDIDDYNYETFGVLESDMLGANFPPSVPRSYFNFMCPTVWRYNASPWYFNLFGDPPDGDIHFDIRSDSDRVMYHPELIMFGRAAGDRFCNTPSRFEIPPQLPGWAETGSQQCSAQRPAGQWAGSNRQ